MLLPTPNKKYSTACGIPLQAVLLLKKILTKAQVVCYNAELVSPVL